MAIGKPLDLGTQHGLPWLVPSKEVYKVRANPPDTVQVWVDRREDIEQVFDIRIL